MRFRKLTLLAVSLGIAGAAEIPRKSPEFAVQFPNRTQARVSQYRGKVLCLIFILTT